MADNEKKKIRFIVNPISGTEKKKDLAPLIRQRIDPSLYEAEICMTQRAGHAVDLAREAAEAGYYAAVAVGGDGTVNEVGRGVLHTSTALGIIPCGSGNGLARHLHIPLDAAKALSALNDGIVSSIDYGLVEGHPFFCTCGVGFDALVSFRFSTDKRRGLLTYLEKALYEFLKYRPETYELETEDGIIRHKAFLITCCNASQYGNNAFISPRASLHDGLLDITILEPFTAVEIPGMVFQLFNKLILQNSRIRSFQCRELTIHRKQPGVAHFDGDPVLLSADIPVRIVQGGLQVVTPRHVEYAPIEQVQNFINPVIEEVATFNRQTLARNIEFLKSLFRKRLPPAGK